MNQVLTTNTYYGISPAAPVPLAPSITMPEPISYEFQVLEQLKNGKIVKVGLQYRKHIHDQYGNIKTFGTWEDVPRVQIEL